MSEHVRVSRRILLSLCFLLGFRVAAAGADMLVWRTEQEQVDAEIEAWPLPRLLDKLSEATGWQVYVDPEARYTVSTRFQKLKPAEALRRLLGELNFALLPQSNGPARLFVYRNSVQDATQLIAPPERSKPPKTLAKPIANELIVTLKPGTNPEELARKLGAKIVGGIDGLNAYRFQFEDEAAAQKGRSLLEANSDVSSVDGNFAIERPANIEPLALSSAPPMSLKPKVTPPSDQIIVGLVDSTVQAGAANLKDFLLPQMSVFQNGEPASDQLTHGTSMAETILRALSQGQQSSDGTTVRILPVDIYGSGGATTTFDVAKGIYLAVNGGATIVNLSLGSEGSSPFLQRLIQDTYKQGVLFVGAAGNQPLTSPVYPAAYPEVLAVTAGDRWGRIAPYANRGDFVDLVAPGANIVYFSDHAYLGTGTSFSAAWVSGMAAGLVSSGKTPAQTTDELRRLLGISPAGK